MKNNARYSIITKSTYYFYFTIILLLVYIILLLVYIILLIFYPSTYKFSTNVIEEKSKTKGIIFAKKDMKAQVDKVTLNGESLPWADWVKHLGNILETDNSFTKDCNVKRGGFVGKIHSLHQEFAFASSEVKMKMYEIYTMSFYGSCLWDFESEECKKLFRAWNVSVRIAFKLPRNSHCYFVEEVSQCPHPKSLLYSRFVKFHQTMLKSDNKIISFLAKLVEKDLRTVHGKNLYNIAEDMQQSIEDLNSRSVKFDCKYRYVPESELWRIPQLHELLDVRNNLSVLDNFNMQDVNDMIHFITTV